MKGEAMRMGTCGATETTDRSGVFYSVTMFAVRLLRVDCLYLPGTHCASVSHSPAPQ